MPGSRGAKIGCVLSWETRKRIRSQLNLVKRNWGLPVEPPHGHDVYIFETTEGKTVTWYCRSNLLAVDCVLYYVFYDWELLSKYSWSLADSKRAEYLVVKNTILTTSVLSNGVLKIAGADMHHAKCVKMRPPVPWYTIGFREDLETIYSKSDELTQKIRLLQRWVRRSNKHHYKRQRLLAARNAGYFVLLGDDLFQMIIEQVCPVFPIRQHECEFDLVHEDVLI